MRVDELGEQYLKTAARLRQRIDELRRQAETLTPQQGYLLLQRIECLEQELRDLVLIGYHLKRYR